MLCRRHNQWIKFVMDESENERMHLMTFMELWQPSSGQRALVVAAQAVFCAGYWVSYVLFPRTSHRFVGTRCSLPLPIPL
jgi:ubiquinol oxidase